MDRLKDKIALITGGSSGIGLATARKFAAEGALVFITGRRSVALEEAIAAIGPRALGVSGDVSDLEDLDRLYAQVTEVSGGLDILFANAGVVECATIDCVTASHFDYIFDINVRGLFFSVQKALPLMRHGGSIILNSSIAGVKGIPGAGVYSASKAAVRSFARTWTLELKDRGIRVNALSPGLIDTTMNFREAQTADEARQMRVTAASEVPIGRVGTPEEVASAALFLASDESSHISGIDLCVDGGMAQV